MRVLLPLVLAAVLQPVQTIDMPVEGRIDHLAADVAGKRLFVAALGNGTLEVLDLAMGKRIRSVAGLPEPQGIAFVPELKRLFVATGGDGACRILDSDSLAVLNTVKFGDDADNVRYDPAARRVWVAYGDGALGAMNTSGKRLGDVRLAGHPESFQLENKGHRIFANVPHAGHVAVIDRERMAVLATWPVRGAAANYPMALDEANRRIFIGCRKPAQVLVLDTANGNTVARVACAGDTDDLFYDATRRRLYVIGGEGAISIIDADHYTVLAKVSTAPGARTGLFVPALERLFLAVPRRPGQPSAIRIFQPQ